MKTNYISLTLIALLFALTTSAQQGINYKAIIHDANGDALVSTLVTVQFSVLEDGETNVYSETHTKTTDANGIIFVNIGEGTLISGDFTNINWGDNPHFLKTEIDKGDGLIDMGTTEFKTVPYALYAMNAGSINIPPDSPDYGQYYFIDNDGDGYGDKFTPVWVPNGVAAPEYFIDNNDDCDDHDGNINPTVAEIPGDYIDQDCDGSDGDPNVDNDGDGFSISEGDCDDNNADINPNADEIIGDGVDNNCDNVVDDDYSCDLSHIGSIDPASPISLSATIDFPGDQDCFIFIPVQDAAYSIKVDDIPGHIVVVNDISDFLLYEIESGDDEIIVDMHAGTEYFIQIAHQDAQGIGAYNLSVSEGYIPQDLDADGFYDYEDCDDTDASIYPGAPCDDGYICSLNDVYDTDCNCTGTIAGPNVMCSPRDECLSPTYCDGTNAECPEPQNDCDNDQDGFTPSQGDCNDSDASVYPGAPEICGDGVDQDCDGETDEECVTNCVNSIKPFLDCTEECNADGTCMQQTCNEIMIQALSCIEFQCYNENFASHTDNWIWDETWSDEEIGNYIISFCGTDDNDSDSSTPLEGDCNDNDASVHPGAIEVCDGQDNNCDGIVDEGCTGSDIDGDGFTITEGDCNNNDASIYPGATEIADDGIDQDCNGIIDDACLCQHGGDCNEQNICENCDEGWEGAYCDIPTDRDGDGVPLVSGDCNDNDPTVYPGAEELQDGLDNDCDGEIDESSGPGNVVINEIDYDPLGPDTETSEFVELYNSGGYPISLDGWTIETTTDQNNFSTKKTFNEVTIGANDFIVEYFTSAIPNGSGGDAVLLKDVNGNYIDIVVYGNDNFNQDGIIDDTGAESTSLAVDDIGYGDYSIGRFPNGIDTDQSGDDFHHGTLTPGAPNNIIDINHDTDGDGYTIVDGDCDDNDNTIYPGATEICGDGIDQDCSGSDLDCIADTDNDGIADINDNCKDAINPDQSDNDGDGVGDVCDYQWGNLIYNESLDISAELFNYPEALPINIVPENSHDYSKLSDDALNYYNVVSTTGTLLHKWDRTFCVDVLNRITTGYLVNDFGYLNYVEPVSDSEIIEFIFNIDGSIDCGIWISFYSELFPDSDIETLLIQKLINIETSYNYLSPAININKVLFIYIENYEETQLLQAAWDSISDEERNSTKLIILMKNNN